MIAGDLNMPRTITALSPGFACTVLGKTWRSQRPQIQLDHILAGRGIELLEGAVLPAVGSDQLPIRARMGVCRMA